MAESDAPTLCPECGFVAQKIITVPNMQTDTSFFATGCVDPRLCEHGDDRIEGRKDWQRRLDKKNLREMDWGELDHPKKPAPAPCM